MEAGRAALEPLWRHHQSFAEQTAAAFAELQGCPPTDAKLRAERSRWVHTLLSYPEPLREAIATTREPLFEVADRSCPTPRGARR